MSVQKRNSEMVDLLRADFQARYEPNFAWVNALSAFSLLPGLRGFWPMSAIGDSVGGVNSDVTDMSGQGRHLTNTGQSQQTNDNLVPYQNFDGTNDYLSRADENGLDILGNETYIATTLRGLTIGGWFYVSTVPPAATKGLIAKWNDNGVNQRAYALSCTNAPLFRFVISTDGAATTLVDSSIVPTSAWRFVVGRFDPSTMISIFVNGTIDTNAVAIPATIFNSTADLNVMAYSNGLATTINHGCASLCFLTATYLPDYYINALFQQTRAMFGI